MSTLNSFGVALVIVWDEPGLDQGWDCILKLVDPDLFNYEYEMIKQETGVRSVWRITGEGPIALYER